MKSTVFPYTLFTFQISVFQFVNHDILTSIPSQMKRNPCNSYLRIRHLKRKRHFRLKRMRMVGEKPQNKRLR